MRVWMLTTVVIAILASGPLALAQGGPVRVTLEPAAILAAPGANATTTIRVAHDSMAPMVVRFFAEGATGGVAIQFDPAELNVLPGQTASATATARGLLAGNWSARIVAQERTALGAEGTSRGSALLQLRIARPAPNATNETPRDAPPAAADATRAPAPAATDPSPSPASPPPPSADPPAPAWAQLRTNATQIALAARRDATATFSILVHNDDDRPQRANVTLRLPLGWGGTLSDIVVDVPAKGSTLVHGSVSPGRAAGDAVGALDLVGPGGKTSVPLALRVETEQPAPAPEEDVRPARVEPEPPVAQPALQPPSPALPTLRVSPAEIGAPPGTSVVLTLTLTNPTDAPLEARPRVEVAPLLAEWDVPTLVAPPGGEASVTFVLRLDADLAEGSEYEGIASTSIQDAGHAPFLVRVSSAGPAPAPAPEPVDARIVLAAGAAAFGSGALLGAGAWRRWPGFGLFALYARLAPRRALEHPRRRKMLDLLRSKPGLTLAQLQREAGLTNGVARHHVALLEAAGVVRSVQDGALRRLWPVGVPIAPPTPGLAERAIATLAARGPMRATELADALGVSRQALHYHVKRLQDEGRLVAKRDAHELTLTLRPA